jgi:4-aminobutyrate aminotransferase-like enzyme
MTAASNADLQRRKEAAVPRGIGVMTEIFAQRAQNAELWDVEGRRYIDFGGGIAVLNVGHRHPKVVAAVREQLERFTHTMFQIVPYELYVALAEKLNQITPGSHPKKTALFSYAGNPLALAAAHTVIDIIREENLLARANALGARLTERLQALRGAVPQIAEVRGLGGMVAVEFNKPGMAEPDADFAKRAQQRALAGGLILLTCRVYANAIRFLFPLTTPDAVFAEALDILEDALVSEAKVALPA